MRASLYMPNVAQPVVELDNVKIVEMNDNHAKSPLRIFFQTKQLNAGKIMVELHRDRKMTLKLDDGTSRLVLLQHQNIDAHGNAVGVLRVLGDG